MGTLNASVRKTHFKERQLPVVAETIKAYKSAGYKIVDGIETVMIIEPDTTFRIFISRSSHSVQFYYLGEPEAMQEFSAQDLESAAQVAELENKYKQTFG